jgi:hypothetical protein
MEVGHPNYPFVLFWILMLSNLLFALLMIRSNEAKSWRNIFNRSNVWRIVLLTLFDAITAIIFSANSMDFWSKLNSGLTMNNWNAVTVYIQRIHVKSDGTTFPIGTEFGVPNYPFLLFWVSMIGNLVFMAALIFWNTKKGSIAAAPET